MSRRNLLVVSFAALAIAAGVVSVMTLRPPKDLADLQASADRASEGSERITENLQRLADNLEAGASLPGDTEAIHALTIKQQDSLERLADLLEQQLDSIAASAQALEDTQTSTDELAELSEAQAAILQRAVAALEDLKSFAASAARLSAEVATSARYGARLAIDSQEAFGP